MNDEQVLCVMAAIIYAAKDHAGPDCIQAADCVQAAFDLRELTRHEWGARYLGPPKPTSTIWRGPPDPEPE